MTDEAKKAAWDEGRLERVHLKLYDNELKEWMDGPQQPHARNTAC